LFRQHLYDGDVASNSASWQWVAGSGADAAPYFRIFNPILQGVKFDPEGAYVRQFVPELSRLPIAYVHAPWTSPPEVLANAGVRVRVLERLPVPGGRTSTISTPEGFKFDLGPTFFLYPRVLEEIFQTCGRDLRQEVEMVRLDPQYRLIFGAGGELSCTPDIARMEAEVSRFSSADRGAFTRFMESTRAKFERFAPFLEQPFQSWLDLASPELIKLVPMLKPWRSLDAELGTFFRDERIRLGFTFQSKYLGMSHF
jgi:phytoene desaturase